MSELALTIWATIAVALGAPILLVLGIVYVLVALAVLIRCIAFVIVLVRSRKGGTNAKK